MSIVPKWNSTRVAPPPERRRAVVIGGGRTGISAAFHLGEHSLLIERRISLEDSHDRSHDFPMGTPGGGALGVEATGANRQEPGVSTKERRALFISCSSSGGAGAYDQKLIHIERWRPPALAPMTQGDEHSDPPSARALIPHLRGELRLDTRVVRISPLMHLIELANGGQIIYDKLLSTLNLASLARLVMHELPARIRCDEMLRYWLGENDIEVADRLTQDFFGDLDELAAGKRVADQISAALQSKFRSGSRSTARGARLFEPRFVKDSAAHLMP